MAADQTTAEQKRLFTEAMMKKLDEQGDERSQFLTEACYEDICAALDGWTEKDGPAKKETQQNFGQVYAWARKYNLVSFSGSKVLVVKVKEEPAEGEDQLALDQSKIVSHQGRVFEDLHKIHIAGGHCKAKTFAMRISTAHGKSVARCSSSSALRASGGSLGSRALLGTSQSSPRASAAAGRSTSLTSSPVPTVPSSSCSTTRITVRELPSPPPPEAVVRKWGGSVCKPCHSCLQTVHIATHFGNCAALHFQFAD